MFRRKKWTQIAGGVFIFMVLAACPVRAEEVSEDITVETMTMIDQHWSVPAITAHTAILMDAQTGEVLYERQSRKVSPPASTTKIMTAILALELSKGDEIVTVSEKAGAVGESSIYLNKGDKIKMSELIEGALVKSGNDACVAIAEQTAGTVDSFVELMNKKVLTIGGYNTHFVNPNGLPAKNHYSCAYDLAIMARYALQNDQFSELVKTKYASISFDEPPKIEQFKNTNKLLWSYPFTSGVKTGTTNEAGKCLVASANKENRKLICVVLNAPDRYGDSQKLFNWGFGNTKSN
ncbi:Serine-type D-Ala-D-Ala carboxypeptidase [Syntrophobotulus glycolicus DSM 8271]|uniref:Serine-type D-Ala-D-Ala carboxypeptidase n=1 Tax=Syntrophobotulus glycolicus (strain DSM 8271 / FlGlyR) TaxID=645991 RepID=F0SU09_SYNGF|nr:Serine-type D-Ala-D-Ala carboxypeptidase [Syntrophobotulus glycolicus DSM 8271]